MSDSETRYPLFVLAPKDRNAGYWIGWIDAVRHEVELVRTPNGGFRSWGIGPKIKGESAVLRCETISPMCAVEMPGPVVLAEPYDSDIGLLRLNQIVEVGIVAFLRNCDRKMLTVDGNRYWKGAIGQKRRDFFNFYFTFPFLFPEIGVPDQADFFIAFLRQRNEATKERMLGLYGRGATRLGDDLVPLYM